VTEPTADELSPSESPPPIAEELLAHPEAYLTTTHLSKLGWSRRAIEAIHRGCPVVWLPGFARGVIRVADYLSYIEQHTYRGDRVRPTRGSVTLPSAPGQGAGRRPR
jgi:hypothetical protein